MFPISFFNLEILSHQNAKMFNVFGFLKKCVNGVLYGKSFILLADKKKTGLYKNIKYLYNNTSIRKNP